MPSNNLRVAVVQNAPFHKDPGRSMERATELIRDANLNDVDVVILSELCFSGYTFKDLKDVEPFLELSDSGPTHDWCSEVAKEFKCYVVASFPEKIEASDSAYLSQMVVDREGRVVGLHRKHALWGPDTNWATPGNSVGTCVEINTKSRRSEDGKSEVSSQTLKCGLGICLDMLCYWNSKLDAQNGKIDQAEHAMADYWQNEEVDVILFSTAEPLYDDIDFREYILENHNFDPAQESERHRGFLAQANKRWKAASSSPEPIDPNEEKKLLDYIVERDWLEPVKPLWDKKTSKKSRAFIVAARTGWEEASDCHFSGASSAYILGSKNQGGEAEARLVGNLDIREEGVLVETLKWN